MRIALILALVVFAPLTTAVPSPNFAESRSRVCDETIVLACADGKYEATGPVCGDDQSTGEHYCDYTFTLTVTPATGSCGWGTSTTGNAVQPTCNGIPGTNQTSKRYPGDGQTRFETATYCASPAGARSIFTCDTLTIAITPPTR